jgi:hypothetical protein
MLDNTRGELERRIVIPTRIGVLRLRVLDMILGIKSIENKYCERIGMMEFHQPELAVSDMRESCEEIRNDGIQLELAVSPDMRKSC